MPALKPLSLALKDMAEEARKTLVQTAIDSVAYVALGNVLRRELSAKHTLTEASVSAVLEKVYAELAEKMRKL